ncbi:hypothetical protein GGC65_004140 [Sphingopyxis sp. OAS728]|uniref:hypothetical protein n=1 Tax=Sphingopyxis sp. OAS728 TaxID=2663823 RepID=UPI00178B02DE|nr:hypothetical protein [Sphingopyxis sp. OAS728]MBE1529684.1 hypothetical protein [Sphingopyxis sp. OAS728]
MIKMAEPFDLANYHVLSGNIGSDDAEDGCMPLFIAAQFFQRIFDVSLSGLML